MINSLSTMLFMVICMGGVMIARVNTDIPLEERMSQLEKLVAELLSKSKQTQSLLAKVSLPSHPSLTNDKHHVKKRQAIVDPINVVPATDLVESEKCACEDGINGTNGLPGPTGPSGLDGTPGIQGQKGESCVTGQTGMTGQIGEAGVNGLKGDAGAKGDRGIPGRVTESGLQGPPGAAGPPGAHGSDGRAGLDGRPGLVGREGHTGRTGAPGERGSSGEKGENGESGSEGPPGGIGQKGDRGIIGLTGDKGDRGIPGLQGTSGQRGPPGPGVVTPAPVTCIGSYRRNPVSNTCIRLVRIAKIWSDAKQFCESAGENLATFSSLESASWMSHRQNTDTAWHHQVWIGGHRTGIEWSWQGRYNGPITYSNWYPGQPSDRERNNCLGAWCTRNTCQWHDVICSYRVWFFCER